MPLMNTSRRSGEKGGENFFKKGVDIWFTIWYDVDSQKNGHTKRQPKGRR